MARPAVLCLLPLLCLRLALSKDHVARTSVPQSGNNGRFFKEEGVSNYSTMLVREDLNLLILGAGEAIFALDLEDITRKQAKVVWAVSDEQQQECKNKGKDSEIDCQNYIRILHKMKGGEMYVCGTNAFNPTCDFMTYDKGKLTLKNAQEDGKGKCPFDPFQRYASVMVDEELFSATSMNFLGSEPVVLRSSAEALRTEFKSSWLNEPNFVHMDHVSESEQSAQGDDDKVYLFFSETAVEFDYYNKLEVSRVARVCKGDMGGQRTLQRKWTSFVKARLDCPVLDTNLPLLVQDVFRWCPGDWRTCVFFAVFTTQMSLSDYSAVCAYSITSIKTVFTEGKFKTPVTVETSFMKWVMYSGDLPYPRPGACIDSEARKNNYKTSLDLPDKTLQFIRDRPLMDQAVQPLTGAPLLIQNKAALTRIVVTHVTALDSQDYNIMFLGTGSGSLLKAVNYAGEMFIIEEVQLFPLHKAVKILRYSSSTDQLYAGSEVGAVQISVSTCGRYQSCLDCVLARDPYCVWEIQASQCTRLSNTHRSKPSGVIQSLRDGDATHCPAPADAKPVNMSFHPGTSVTLKCSPSSNLARTVWTKDGHPLPPSKNLHMSRDSLIILDPTDTHTGRYVCSSVEKETYIQQVAAYLLRLDAGRRTLQPQAQRQSRALVTLQVLVVLLSLMLVTLVVWNLYQGHCPLFKSCRGKAGGAGGAGGSGHQGRHDPLPLCVPEENNGTPSAILSTRNTLSHMDEESHI